MWSEYLSTYISIYLSFYTPVHFKVSQLKMHRATRSKELSLELSQQHFQQLGQAQVQSDTPATTRPNRTISSCTISLNLDLTQRRLETVIPLNIKEFNKSYESRDTKAKLNNHLTKKKNVFNKLGT